MTNNIFGLHQADNTKRFVCFKTKEATESPVTTAPLSALHHRPPISAVFFIKLSTSALRVQLMKLLSLVHSRCF